MNKQSIFNQDAQDDTAGNTMQNPIKIFQVSELNKLAKMLLEDTFPDILIEGEISNFSAPSSGHWYFSLKDKEAQVRCAMFRSKNLTIPFKPKDGLAVLLKTSVSLYPDRGDFQLIVSDMQEQGHGALQIQFEKLKEKLKKAGLFDAIHKKALPEICHRVAVITSPTGAAIRDVLTTLNRRYPLMDILIYPTQVQGKAAANTIVAAIQQANLDNKANVILLVRGGGSLEDLWSFNEEIVAQAIHESQLPIVTGVGHETDFTIADFVADHRAATPTAAAEWISPNCLELLLQVERYKKRLAVLAKQLIDMKRERVNSSHKQLLSLHPKKILQNQLQKVDFLRQTLTQLIGSKLHTYKHQLANHADRLNTLSPLKTLSRGYSISIDLDKNKTITRISDTSIGNRLLTRLADGEILSIIEAIK